MQQQPQLNALGASRTTYAYDDPDPSVLETVPAPSPSSGLVVSLHALEFTSLCPVTGQPDYGQIDIDYVPASRIVESKSLKLYLMRYRNHGAFHESCVARIAEDLQAVLEPRYLVVLGRFNARGGIAIWPMREVAAPGEDARELGELVARARDAARGSR